MDAAQRDEFRAARSRPAVIVVVAMLGIIALSLFVHLRELSQDPPIPGGDEPYFVLPAARMAWKGDPDAQWFGHPGSTVIDPLAIAYRAREDLFHGAPLFGEAPSVAARFRSDPTSFYEIGRLWVILLSVATVPLLFLLARRAFGDLTAIIAAFCWALMPLADSYGTVVRTDAAGACFGLLSLLLCLVALDDPRLRHFALAGAAIGLAVASRYFMVVLVPVLVAVWWIARSRDRARVSPKTLVIGLGAAFALFALTTPFFFLDWHAVSRSLEAEAVGAGTNDRSGWLDNVGYYAGEGIPDAISWVASVFAIAGVAIACLRRDARRLVLVGFVTLFLAAISLSSLHANRWAIQVLPLILVFAASAVVTFGRYGARLVRARDARRWVLMGVVIAGTLAIAVGPAVSLVDYVHTQDRTSTRELMRAWIEAHVPAGTRIAYEVSRHAVPQGSPHLKGPDLSAAGYPVLDRYDLPTDGTLGDYAAHGYHYFVVNGSVALRYRNDAKKYPEHARFYDFLRERGDLIADFPESDATPGSQLKLYYMDPAILAAPHRPQNVAVTSRSSHDQLAHPRPLYPVGEEILTH